MLVPLIIIDIDKMTAKFIVQDKYFWLYWKEKIKSGLKLSAQGTAPGSFYCGSEISYSHKVQMAKNQTLNVSMLIGT